MAGKFKLQPVLNYRQSLEDQAQQALAASLQLRGELENRLLKEQEQLGQNDAELKQRQKKGMTIAEIDLFEAQIGHHRRVISQLREGLGQLEEKILAQREVLFEAARNREIMEKLKARKVAEQRRELDRRERAMLDEISLRGKGEEV